MRVWRTLRKHPSARVWLADGAVMAALLVLFAVQLATEGSHVHTVGQRSPDVLTVALTLAMVGPYLFHRRAPLTAAGVNLAAMLTLALIHSQVYPGINVFVLLFGICLHTDDRGRRIAVFTATLSVLTVSVWVQPDGVATVSTWVSTLLFATVAGLVGDNLRHRRARWAALAERARYMESEREERARRAVIDERLRIARELHDVVAHSMSVVAVQAGVGHHVLDTQPEEARRALAAIETTSRAALAEMRRLLGVLREEGQTRAALSPAAGLDDLPLLLAQVREAGLEVALTVTGRTAETPLPVDLTTFRIVQEALTNALKHGGPQAVVHIDYTPAEVRLEITDVGRPGGACGGSGHGLIGMAERVAIFGGRLSTGARPGGGFRVAACLPLTRDPW